MKSATRWLMVLFLATAGVLIGAAARAQATPNGCVLNSCAADTTSTTLVSDPSVTTVTTISTSSTTTPSTGHRTPYAATFTPCTSDGTSDGSEPCDVTPADIQVSYPGNQPPDLVQVSWVATGRSAAAPDPDTTSVTLTAAQGTSCGTGLLCWPWPAAMDDSSFVLNGTYQIVVCPFGFGQGGQCSSGAALPAQSVGLAVPPGVPTKVSAQSGGSEVAISWNPPTSAPPDLVGYSIDRNNSAVYTCSTDDLGPGAATPCPSNLEVADHPGDGEYTYGVTALRLGVDDASANVVSSSVAGDSQGVVTVPGPITPAPGSGSGSGGQGAGSSQPGTLIPLSGGSGETGSYIAGAGSSGVGGTEVTIGQVTASAVPGATSPPIPKLSYPTSSDGTPAHPQALALKVVPPAGKDDVVPVAVLALGILSLAVAAHFLYLRVELGVVQTRLAARRATGI